MYSDRNKQEIVKKNIQKIRNTVNDNYKNKRSKYNKWVSEHQFTKAMAYLYANLLYDVTKSELPPNGSNLIKIFKKATLRVHPNKGGSHELFISASNAVNKLKLWHKYNNKKNNKRKEEEENRKRKQEEENRKRKQEEENRKRKQEENNRKRKEEEENRKRKEEENNRKRKEEEENRRKNEPFIVPNFDNFKKAYRKKLLETTAKKFKTTTNILNKYIQTKTKLTNNVFYNKVSFNKWIKKEEDNRKRKQEEENRKRKQEENNRKRKQEENNRKRKEEEENRKRKEKGEVQILDKNYSIRDTRKLILFNRGLEIIPKDVFKLTNLEYLHLEVNHLLTSIPEEIGNLKNLKYLNLSRNSRITSIPDTIGNLKNLEELYLDFNNLTSIPDTIGNLENLEFLNLGHNNITSIPDTIGNLTNLLNLHLEYNNLRTIPDVFKNLTQLRELNFMSTKVVTPPSVFDLANLKIIYFSHYIFTPNLISKMISSKFKENIKIYHKHYEPKSKMKSYNKSQFILFLKSKQNEKFTNRLMSALKLKYSKLHKK